MIGQTRPHRHLRQEADPKARGDHLHQSRQGGGGEDVLAARRVDLDCGQGLVAQTVAVFEQDQVLSLQSPFGDRPGPRQGVTGRRRRQDLIVADAGVIDARRVIGQGDDGGVQLTRLQPGDQARRQILAQEQPQAGIEVPYARQGLGQQERGHRGNDAQAEPARQGLARVLGGLDQILGAGQNVLGPPHRLGADGRQDHRPARPFDHGGAQHPFQLLHPGRQGGLADVSGLGRSAEGAVLGQKFQILELTQGRQNGHVSRIRERRRHRRRLCLMQTLSAVLITRPAR